MPIVGLSDRRRLPRVIKIRLGKKATNAAGKEYPTEVDYFVLRPEDFAQDDIRKEVQAVYGEAPKSLKMMLPFEVDSTDPDTGDELVFNVNNRAYGAGAGLRCKGTGSSEAEPGTAETTDPKWAERVAATTGRAPEHLANGRYKLACWGRDCPLYASPEHGRDAACKAVAVLRAFLLHPTEDETSPDYCRVFGIAEIVTSSYNTMIDVRSGLEMLRPFAQRTSAIPFWLVRRPRVTFHDGKRSTHFTCVVTWKSQETQRIGLTAPSEVFLPIEMRRELRALGDPDYDSVKDIYPAPAGHLAAPAEESAAVAPGVSSDRDEVVAQAVEGAFIPAGGAETDDAVEPLDQLEEERFLTNGEREELKGLCGERTDPDDARSPWSQEAIDRLRELAEQAHTHFETEPVGGLLSGLQVRHGRWIRERVAEAASREVA